MSTYDRKLLKECLSHAAADFLLKTQGHLQLPWTSYNEMTLGYYYSLVLEVFPTTYLPSQSQAEHSDFLVQWASFIIHWLLFIFREPRSRRTRLQESESKMKLNKFRWRCSGSARSQVHECWWCWFCGLNMPSGCGKLRDWDFWLSIPHVCVFMFVYIHSWYMQGGGWFS